MPRLEVLEKGKAEGKARELLDGVEKKMGMVPNLMATMAQAPPVLEAYLAFSTALSKGVLPAKLREQIALTVGEANGCEYCLAAHTLLGKNAGLTEKEIADSRRGFSSDAKAESALTFARQIVEARGHVDDGAVARLKSDGFTDGEITEIIANVALNLFTNYFNHVADTEVDFPAVQPLEARTNCAC